ncbi:MAG: hypothetical protein ACK4N5_12525 [Myxococcales bacterium]
MPAASFYASLPDTPRDDLLDAYLRFLEARNGTADATVPYPRREEWLADVDGAQARHRGHLDADTFDRLFADFDANEAPDAPVCALLAFAKANAGEAYGVEVLTRMRHGRPPTSELFDRVERVIAQEETYHTRILLGVTRQFGVPAPRSAFRPPLPLKLLIGTLAYAPKAVFHPILLAAELGGVFSFDWLLRRSAQVFAGEPEVRDLMEARLVEILIDEVGHIAFNRLAVGPAGLATARYLAPDVAEATSGRMPEYRALGWSRAARDGFEAFNLDALPEEVRRRAFFV